MLIQIHSDLLIHPRLRSSHAPQFDSNCCYFPSFLMDLFQNINKSINIPKENKEKYFQMCWHIKRDKWFWILIKSKKEIFARRENLRKMKIDEVIYLIAAIIIKIKINNHRNNKKHERDYPMKREKLFRLISLTQ